VRFSSSPAMAQAIFFLPLCAAGVLEKCCSICKVMIPYASLADTAVTVCLPSTSFLRCAFLFSFLSVPLLHFLPVPTIKYLVFHLASVRRESLPLPPDWLVFLYVFSLRFPPISANQTLFFSLVIPRQLFWFPPRRVRVDFGKSRPR